MNITVEQLENQYNCYDNEAWDIANDWLHQCEEEPLLYAGYLPSGDIWFVTSDSADYWRFFGTFDPFSADSEDELLANWQIYIERTGHHTLEEIVDELSVF